MRGRDVGAVENGVEATGGVGAVETWPQAARQAPDV